MVSVILCTGSHECLMRHEFFFYSKIRKFFVVYVRQKGHMMAEPVFFGMNRRWKWWKTYSPPLIYVHWIEVLTRFHRINGHSFFHVFNVELNKFKFQIVPYFFGIWLNFKRKLPFIIIIIIIEWHRNQRSDATPFKMRFNACISYAPRKY